MNLSLSIFVAVEMFNSLKALSKVILLLEACKISNIWWPLLLGGIADVAGSLPKALTRRGHRVTVVAPWYGHEVEVRYFQTYIDGVDFIFIESLNFHHLEQNIY